MRDMMETNKTRNHNDRTRWLFFLWGLLSGLLLAVMSAGVILGVALFQTRDQRTAGLYEVPDASVQLSVAADGCGVIRGEVNGKNAVDGITWVIEDADGFVVLERTADAETRYRYFAAGQYTVTIKARYHGRYYTISNAVEIDC